MRRRLLIVLFSLGVVFGFGSGIARLLGHHHDWRHGRQGWAETCARAAVDATRAPPGPAKD